MATAREQLIDKIKWSKSLGYKLRKYYLHERDELTKDVV
jgi:hypothetical protein